LQLQQKPIARLGRGGLERKRFNKGPSLPYKTPVQKKLGGLNGSVRWLRPGRNKKLHGRELPTCSPKKGKGDPRQNDRG